LPIVVIDALHAVDTALISNHLLAPLFRICLNVFSGLRP